MVDLSIRLTMKEDPNRTEKDGKIYSLQASLRASYAEMHCQERRISFRAAVKRLMIGLEFEGLEMAPGPRPHDPIRQGGETVKTSDKSETKTEAQLTGNANIALGISKSLDTSLDTSAMAKKSWTNSKTIEKINEISSRCVTAKPGDRWEVSDVDRKFLDATYLTENDPLGDVIELDRTNRRATTATVEVFQRDLHIEIIQVSKIMKLVPEKIHPNKQKLAAIVIAKDLGSAISGAYSGRITLCRAIDEDE